MGTPAAGPQRPPACSLPAPAAVADPDADGAGVRALGRALALGDDAAIAALYHARFPLVLATARRITGRDEAFGLDVVQDTFLRVIRARRVLTRIASDADLDRWLVRITHTAALDLLRRERRRTARERSRGSGVSTTDEPSADHLDWLACELAKLEFDERQMLRMRTEGRTLAAIAAAFGLTPGAAHGRVRRALQTLTRASRENDHAD